MFLNRFNQNLRIISLQRPLQRNFNANAKQFTHKLKENTVSLVGLGCSLTILSTLGLAFAQTENSELESDSTKEAGLKQITDNDINKSKKENNEKERRYLKNAIKKSQLRIEQLKEEIGTPALICAVSIDGDVVWKSAVGFSDVENGVRCNVDTKMRIASISKALTSIGIGKLLQQDKIDLDAPIQKYIKYFPEKEFDNEKVTITARQLMSHTSGVRHYEKSPPKQEENGEQVYKDSNKESSRTSNPKKEFENKEYYIKDHYKTTKESAKIFLNDPLLKKPGTDYLYSTHAWTLLSAVIEETSGMDYVSYMKNICYDLGLDNTLVELNDPIIYNRSRNYSRDEKGKLRNTPYVDNSYKIAGGGFLSTAEDLLKIGNVMLYCHQSEAMKDKQKGFLDKEIVDKLWTIESATKGKVSKKFKNLGFGLGWKIQPEASEFGCCRNTKFAATHSGAAVGASSVLLIIPRKENTNEEEKLCHSQHPEATKNPDRESAKDKPRGIVITIMVNFQDVGLLGAAFEIANNFEEF